MDSRTANVLCLPSTVPPHTALHREGGASFSSPNFIDSHTCVVVLPSGEKRVEVERAIVEGSGSNTSLHLLTFKEPCDLEEEGGMCVCVCVCVCV